MKRALSRIMISCFLLAPQFPAHADSLCAQAWARLGQAVPLAEITIDGQGLVVNRGEQGFLAGDRVCERLEAESGIVPDVTRMLQGAPIPYTPFTLADLGTNPATGQAYGPNDIVSAVNAAGEALLRKNATAVQVLDLLNRAEAEYAKVGRTLREGKNIAFAEVLRNEGEILNQKAFVRDIAIDFLRERARPALSDCRQIALEHLGTNPQTRQPFRPDDKVNVGGGARIRADELVERVNEMQLFFCAVGYDLVGSVSRSGDRVVDALLAKRDELMRELGIPAFHRAFNMESIRKIRTYVELAQEAEEILASRKLPSPEKLIEMGSKLNVALPEAIRFPDLPVLRNPVIPKRKDLKLQKRKVWPGFRMGSADAFQAYSSAEIEISGSETAQQLWATGEAGVNVFSQNAKFVYGHAWMLADQTGAQAKFRFNVFGQDKFNTSSGIRTSFRWGDPRAFHMGADKSWMKRFVIGFVPCYVRVGAAGEIYLGVEATLDLLRIRGTVTPGADAKAYGEFAAGVDEILAGGVRGDIVLVRLDLPLAATAQLVIDKANPVPALNLDINASAKYDLLSGKLSAFVKYFNPIDSLLSFDWKVSEHTYDLWDWGGYRDQHKIMNWGMDLSPGGARMRGDLADRSDLAESLSLDANLRREQAEQHVAILENEVLRTEAAAFQAIGQDLQDIHAVSLASDAALLVQGADVLEAHANRYFRELQGWMAP